MSIGRNDFERAIRAVHTMNAQTGFTSERIEALLMSVVRSLVESGMVDEAALDQAIERRKAKQKV